MRKTNLIIAGSIIFVVALLLGGISYYQATRFNTHIVINDTNVGGLTAEQAMKKLKSSVLKNEVYIGKERILDEKDTKLGFTNEDLPSIKKLLEKQRTFFPSSKAVTYTLVPSKEDQYRSQTLKKLVEEKLTSMNQSLKAPQDAQAHLEQSKVTISKSVKGEQYDVAELLKDYEKQEHNSTIQLNAVYMQPIEADDPIVKEEEKKLQDLLGRTIDYKVQNQVYSLKASELIKNASISKDMQYSIDTTDIKNKIAEINSSQSTLNKDYTFKTHLGSVISVKGQTYGWAINIDKETKRIQESFAKGETSLSASNIYGVGYSTYGIGYDNTTNNGIGNTYAEVSISEQRIWIYKNGQLAVTTNVVTGKHVTNEDTPPGVWYIMYKESPSTLEGSSVGNPNYSVKVNYWAPFTNSGCGFHDASWRKNWASDAYVSQGSGCCVNTPSDAMKAVYDNLSQNDPVVVY
ncbi:L,D-transpeptidase family protein [Ectobacillus funiculus]|uniref:L,D-transpeptidase family protein n=1 Tax=Ectobacillus funiculus TaxID=137993 RepID=UPI00101D657E|nr:L,D-transpeptidase family protein [Ectobacillus funiculus]